MKKAVGLAIGATLIAGAIVLGIVGIASAQMMPGVGGTVSAINGDTLTITARAFAGAFGRRHGTSSTPPMMATTTYTVDATNATVLKNGTSSTISAISVGDMVFAQGTISGTNVTATKIIDGAVVPGAQGQGQGGFGDRFGGPGPKRGPWNASGTWPGNASGTPPHGGASGFGAGGMNIIQGNGEPVIGGSVTTISGSTLTVTTASDTVVYTVDGSNATIEKRGVASSTISNIAIGDDVLVQGSVSGTSVAATSILDQGAPRAASSTNGGSNGNQGGIGVKIGAGIGGFFGAIGNVFHRLFGFF